MMRHPTLTARERVTLLRISEHELWERAQAMGTTRLRDVTDALRLLSEALEQCEELLRIEGERP